MKRLFNEFSAAPYEGDAVTISEAISLAVNKIWNEVVVANNVDPRDAESLCHHEIYTMFAENILRLASKKAKTNLHKQ